MGAPGRLPPVVRQLSPTGAAASCRSSRQTLRATIDGMESPLTGSEVRVPVDKQGRLVLPQWLRRRLVPTPGEVLLRETADGVLITAVASVGQVEEAADGLPVLRVGHPVSNDQVKAAIAQERAER